MHIFTLTISVSRDFCRKEERDLLSLISLGIEFQRDDPSYIKLFSKNFYAVAVNKEYLKYFEDYS